MIHAYTVTSFYKQNVEIRFYFPFAPKINCYKILLRYWITFTDKLYFRSFYQRPIVDELSFKEDTHALPQVFCWTHTDLALRSSMESVLPDHLTKDNYDSATYDLDNYFQLWVLVELSNIMETWDKNASGR